MTFPLRGAVTETLVYRRNGASSGPATDAVATEEPLEVRLQEGDATPRRLLVTMRTPGHDEDLAVGLLFTEGLVSSAGEVLALERPPEGRIDPDVARNVLIAKVSERESGRRRIAGRHGVGSSACGVCGRRSIESVLDLPATASGTIGTAAPPTVAAEVLVSLPDRLGRAQDVFLATGGLHAAGLFGPGGELVVVREDVGRHNATDKVIGSLLRAGGPVPCVLLVSGRIGFEIAQKAARLGVTVLAALSAPTSLAVELAEASGLSLVGFLRGGSFNVYAHPERIDGLDRR